MRKSRGLNKSRPRKRKQVFNPKTGERDDGEASTSAKKLKNQHEYHVPKTNTIDYRIINFFSVFSVISNLVKCAKCNGEVSFGIGSERGLGLKISLTCENCTPEYIPSCDFIKHSYEINRRFMLAMRILGVGFNGAQTFCVLMDFPPFIARSTYCIILEHICEASRHMAEFFMKKACKVEVQCNSVDSENENSDLTVSGDGRWHKRGFTSLFGVTSPIGHFTGKIIDVIVKSSYCKDCEVWEDKKGSVEYEEWYEIHEESCPANHTGSAGKMEASAMVEMFRRLIKNLGVRYLKCVGEGDSKTFSEIVKDSPYGKTAISIKECVGHVQKRMGTRLRGLKKTTKGLSGKGKLTGKLIDQLTGYYGNAIRNNCDSVEKMKTAIWATSYHKNSTDGNPQHDNCPSGADSWYKYQQAEAQNKLESFEHDYTAFPELVANSIKPIYEALRKDDLLQRCIRGFTQNSNESFYQSVCKIMPKTLPASFTTVSIAANIATCTFNEGAQRLLSIFDAMGVKLGTHAHDFAKKEDALRVATATRRSAENFLEGRILRRKMKIPARAADKAKEGTFYGPGIDD